MSPRNDVDETVDWLRDRPYYEGQVRAHEVYPGNDASFRDVGLGVYLTVTGSTARDHGLRVGEALFPSETVLLENPAEAGDAAETVAGALVGDAGTPTVRQPDRRDGGRNR